MTGCKKAPLPLAAYEDFSAYKMSLSDIGLMCATSNVPVQSLLNDNVLFSGLRDAPTEQYVLQQLKTNLRCPSTTGLPRTRAAKWPSVAF